MMMKQLTVFIAVAALTVVVVSAAGASYDGYSSAVPRYPLSELYEEWFYNLPHAKPCVTTGNVFKSAANGGWSSTSSIRGTIGCRPFTGEAMYFMLPISPSDAATLKQECDTLPEAQWGRMESLMTRTQGDLSVILTPPKSQFAQYASAGRVYDFQCILRQITEYNRRDSRGPVRDLVANAALTDTTRMGREKPVLTYSPYGNNTHSWNPNGVGENWVGHDMSASVLDVALTSAEWLEVQKRAYFNRMKLNEADDSEVAPKFVSETRWTMRQIRAPLPTAKQSCLTLSVPTCLPIGGLSVWATTQQDIPSWQQRENPTAPPARLTAPGSIAIMVSATSTAFFHDMVPGANTAAAGTTALMAFINAISGSFLDTVRYSAGTPQLYFFFFVGEEYGLSGSGRFVKEVRDFRCSIYPQYNTTEMSCMFPYYRYTNFTSVDLDQFEHFIAIDQVGIGSSLYFHADQTIEAVSPAQQRMSSAFSAAGARRSSVGQVPPSSLYSMMNAFNTSTRNTKSFTLLSSYDTSFNNPNFEATTDTPDLINTTLVFDAAQVALDAVTSVLKGNAPLAALPQPAVNTTFAGILWHCMAENLRCDYFRDTFGFRPVYDTPNYYSSVFAFYQSIGQQMQFLFYYSIDQLKDTTGPYNQTQCPCQSWYDLCIYGKCYPMQAFWHHSFSPELEYVNRAPIYFNQSQNLGSTPGEIWVESFWDNDIGQRMAALESDAHNSLILGFGFIVVALTVAAMASCKLVVAPKLKVM